VSNRTFAALLSARLIVASLLNELFFITRKRLKAKP
jgi:hypothetical protein